MKPSLTNVLVGLALLVLGYYSGRQPGETVVLTRVDTVPYAAFRDSLKSSRMESTGLRAKLAGRGVIEPRTILRTDTLVSPPDTVLQIVNLTNHSLLVGALITTDSLWMPEIHRFDVGECDDGWSWNAGELVCDRARFGHLSIGLRAGISAETPFTNAKVTPLTEAGIEWRAAHRSPWGVQMTVNQCGAVALTMRREWAIW